MLYALAPEDGRLVLKRFETSGWPTRAREAAVEFMSNVPTDFAYFNPLKAPSWQRNRVLSEAQLARKTGKPAPAAIQVVILFSSRR
ncbi:MAG: hypothetical protein AB7K71_28410 [Polyangiaceae bacterium]